MYWNTNILLKIPDDMTTDDASKKWILYQVFKSLPKTSYSNPNSVFAYTVYVDIH